MIEPPDTLEIASRAPSRPVSASRRSAPAWKSIARDPPPERQSAVPVRTLTAACGATTLGSPSTAPPLSPTGTPAPRAAASAPC